MSSLHEVHQINAMYIHCFSSHITFVQEDYNYNINWKTRKIKYNCNIYSLMWNQRIKKTN
jgi:hypothetical protein